MPAGLDVATGVAGLISVSVTLFQGCVQAFNLVSAAKHIGEDADRVRCMLDWELYRLLQWGERIGLDGAAVQDRKLNWVLITDVLKQLQGLLTDARLLRDRYNLDLCNVDVDDAGKASRQMESNAGGMSDRKGIGRLWSYVRPDLQNARARIIKENTGPMKKFRWAALDQGKVRALIGDIGHFNNCLHDLLASAEQDFVRATLSALLRDLVSRSTLSSDLDIIKAMLEPNYIAQSSSIEAAASLKQIRLLVGIDKRLDEKSTLHSRLPSGGNIVQDSLTGSTEQTLSKLSHRSLLRDSNHSGVHDRELAGYQSSRKGINAQVLVKWKPVERQSEEKLKRRIEGLALLMSNTSDPSFHSLRCLGFIRHESQGPNIMYAFVYEVANLDEEDPPYVNASLRPLSSLFTDARRPSLTCRIRLALALAETILQLHTSGWLHKGIRSENVLFIDRGEHQWDNGTSLGPYVAGYEYARADNPLEMTEDAPSNPTADLYRHPKAQGIARPSFKKAFDLYALGCVLLEIALWTSLQDILVQFVDPFEFLSQRQMNPNTKERSSPNWGAISKGKERLLDKEWTKEILNEVAFQAGDRYRSAVETCFSTSSNVDNNDMDLDEDAESSVNTQIRIVKLLGQPQL